QVFIGGDASSLRSLGTWDFNGYDVFKVEADIDWSDIGSNGTLVIRVATLGDAENFDRVSLSYALLRYPQTITAGAENAFINLPPNAGGKSYLTIPGVPPAVRLFDVTNPRRVRLRSEEHTSELQSRENLVCR